MMQLLQDIFQLEESEQFDKAFEAYANIYSQNKNDFKVWKHFYFFLWTAIEDAPESFHDKINLRLFLQEMYDHGKKLFFDLADFNFIAGYTVSIFPYEYGDYSDLEKVGQQMLLKATEYDPGNLIYKMVYLGSLRKGDKAQYKQVEIDAASKVLDTFKGSGSLNKYFRKTLFRTPK